MKSLFAALLSLLLAFAAKAEILLVPETVSFGYLGQARLELLMTNTGDAPSSFAPPSELKGRLHGATELSRDVVLVREGGGPVQVAPGGFAKASYLLRLPVGFSGPVVLDVAEPGVRPTMFTVLAPDQSAVANSAPSTPASQAADGGKSVERETALRRSTQILSGISPYEPVYFGMGNHGGLNAKFQVSLKYNPFDQRPFYLGYTQTSLWDLHSTSKPFRDTSYRPAVFYQDSDLWVSKDERRRLGLQAGFEHESNGKAGDDSRSINLAVVRPRFEWNIRNDTKLIVAPKIYGYLDKSENSDIIDYRGVADFYVGLVRNDYRLSTVLRRGLKDRYGSVQVDLVFPLRASDELLSRLRVHGMNGYFFIQYFNGWGESILDYNHKLPSQFRAGLMIVP